ncbi:NAD-P-binding protein [Mycena galericulata]|nr:NAD-P-binding protein [Mycena galericulata]
MPSPSQNWPGLEEDFLDIPDRKDVYPYIDPAIYYESQSYAGKVAFITGASRGIGAETALKYALAGAAVSLTARHLDTLETSKQAILAQAPSAQIFIIAADVTHARQVERAVAETVAHFGHIDILIANAGWGEPWTEPLHIKDPDKWWAIFEVNVRGAFNCLHFCIPHLLKTKGYVVVVSSKAAQVRIPNGSDYAVSKHAVGRLVEHVHLESPEIKIFALNPGSVATLLGLTSAHKPLVWATVALPAATILRLTSGEEDWLAGRYVSANWDLGLVNERWKAKVMEKGGLVSKLYIPS